jgi:hypothetical protein
MPIRAEFNKASAVYEAAKAEFEALQRVIQERLTSRDFVSVAELNNQELARINLSHASDRLSRTKRP